MLSCKQVTGLGSDLIDRQLTLRAHMALLAHLGLCSRCRRYVRQLRLTSRTLQALAMEDEPASAEILARVRKRQPDPRPR
ncbi:anti-sigma factor family protein [Pseudomonas oligotrophica]|uniref:anti-sigma factor family protein n=1 Tax=Pseudomonas oligotrophica TaxID=2912055 RepID=UPI001F1CFEB5|nr:anti-sigma factor [Pseudomonas oligotrophica]MCF7202382.1 anti-sigma factor [Pseudomonas oligotrophica]